MKTWTVIHKHLEQHQSCALITVAKVAGSTPREAGAQMIVLKNGQYHGTIGGGTLEWEAIRSAQQHLNSERAFAGVSKHVLGADLGQCCGGVVHLLTETFTCAQIEQVSEMVDLASTAEHPTATLGTVSTTPNPSPGTIPSDIVTRGIISTTGVRRERIDARRSSNADTAIREEPYPRLVSDKAGVSVIIEQHGQQRHSLYVFGAGHVGRALILALASLPFNVVWVDERVNAFPTHLPANVLPILTPNPIHALAQAPDSAMVLVMTHSHRLDLELVGYALQANRFDYVGLIGSESKRGRFINRLRRLWIAQGTPAQSIRARIKCLTCPIGVAGIASKHPATIAASTTAQLLQQLEASATADRADTAAESVTST